MLEVSLGPPDCPDLAALPSPAEEPIAAIRLKPRYARPSWHVELLHHRSRPRIDAPHVAFPTLPGVMPQLTIDPRDASDEAVYHTYSTYARGLNGLWGMYQWLDRAPLGRNESGVWWRRHDEYKG